jgi:hypothetical protein
MPVHAQVAAAGARVRPVQQDVVRAEKPGAAGYLNAQTQNGAGVDGVRVGVARAEGGEGGAGAVEALLVVGLLEVGLGEEFSFEGCLDGGGGVAGMAWEGERSRGGFIVLCQELTC